MVNGKQNLRDAIRSQALAAGFAVCGFAPAALAPRTGERLRQWLKQGRHGDMIWMESRADQRADPQALWPQVQSVVMLGMSYAPGRDPMALADNGNAARISVYAQGGDYHKTVKQALKRLARTMLELAGDTAGVKVFVDTAPVMEKPLAEAAGIGWQGKHTNLVSRDFGSWLFLGAIYTTLELPEDPPGADRCGSCHACQDVCPTNAFPAPYQLDARACISYLTIEHAGPIPHRYRRPIGNHVYGCDDCLAVCPWNKFAAVAQANRAFLPRAELAAPAIGDLLALDDGQFRAVFSGSPIKRSGRNRIVRNALIAAGNSGDLGLVAPVVLLLDDPSAIVRGAAIWALAELDPIRFAEERRARIEHEDDPQLVAEWAGLCPVETSPEPVKG